MNSLSSPDLHMSVPNYTANWPVEVMQLRFTDWESLNPQLIALIESELAKDNWIGTDRKGTTRGGWRTPPSFRIGQSLPSKPWCGGSGRRLR
jgi:hypothetical protein